MTSPKQISTEVFANFRNDGDFFYSPTHFTDATVPAGFTAYTKVDDTHT